MSLVSCDKCCCDSSPVLLCNRSSSVSPLWSAGFFFAGPRNGMEWRSGVIEILMNVIRIIVVLFFCQYYVPL